jgi:hypothetical protein
MTERREVVVGSALQAHQLRQYLTKASVEFTALPMEHADGVLRWPFIIQPTPEQWTGVMSWLERIAPPGTRLVDTGSFFVRVPKEES